MRPVLDQQKNKRSFSPFYLAIFSGILLTILIINGVLEINRTKNGFYLLLEREATVLIQHYEKNIQDALSMLQLLENAPGAFPPPCSAPSTAWRNRLRNISLTSPIGSIRWMERNL